MDPNLIMDEGNLMSQASISSIFKLCDALKGRVELERPREIY